MYLRINKSSCEAYVRNVRNLLIGILILCSCRPCERNVRNDVIPVSTQCEIREIKNYEQLRTILQRYDLPCQDMFVKIAMYESAWLKSSLHVSYHNTFGWCYTEHEDICANVYGSAHFASYEKQFEFMVKWVNLNPKRPNESCEDYFRRRHYNVVNPNYYNVLKQINY
jgi:uncharacterized FlgJ-related protein